MFYFHDPLINSAPSPVTPPAMMRVVAAPTPLPLPPKGWQWAKSSPPAVTVRKEGNPDRSPAANAPTPSAIVATSSVCEPATPAQETPASAPQVVSAPVASAALPTWSVVSWKNLGPRSITGTRKEAVSLVENLMSMAGIHHLDIHVYDAIHVIVALERS